MFGSLQEGLGPCEKCRTLWRNKLHTQRKRFASSSGLKYPKNHYEVLGLKPSATPSQIKESFVNLSKEIHPDRNPTDPMNHEKFVKLNDAYTVLSKPSSRREYDARLSLASRLYQQQTAARNVYGTHTPGASHSPGTGPEQGFYEGDQQQRVFWDETIFYMRDKSKDYQRFNKEDSYYGIKGLRRLPNSYIVIGCFGIMALGVMLHLSAFRWSKRVRSEIMDRNDRRNNSYLVEARARARLHGNTKQLELLNSNGIIKPKN